MFKSRKKLQKFENVWILKGFSHLTIKDLKINHSNQFYYQK